MNKVPTAMVAGKLAPAAAAVAVVLFDCVKKLCRNLLFTGELIRREVALNDGLRAGKPFVRLLNRLMVTAQLAPHR